jgi:hypothetical protein
MGPWSRVELPVRGQQTGEMKPLKTWFNKLFSRERRRAKRIPAVSLVAHYWDGAAPVSHTIRDVSSIGLYLVTEQRWYLGTMIRMTLQRSDLPEEDKRRSIQVLVKVIRAGDDGVGCAFVPMDNRTGSSRDADAMTLNKFLKG